MAALNDIQLFWQKAALNLKPSQLERYVAAGAPDYIQKFIAMGGGQKMGTTCEKFARHRFSTALKPRAAGAGQTGYDHRLILSGGRQVLVEQKSSGHWGENDYKWQHVEPDHKWQLLLLCGIDYTDIHFWAMDRPAYNALRAAGKITNQGNAAGDSSEGTWFSWSVVKDSLVPIRTETELVAAGHTALAAPEALVAAE
jgi:hypothetical protein